MFIKNNRISFSPLNESDLDLLTIHRSDPDTWQFLGSIGENLSCYRQKIWFENLQKDLTKRYFVVKSNQQETIGYVRIDELDHFNKSIRVGADILKQYRKLGYGTEVYKLLLEFCFNHLGMNRVWLLVLETNLNAINLYLKTGFIQEGIMRQAIFKNNSFVNYLMMSILKEEYYAKFSE